jgi:hypothetical protein
MSTTALDIATVLQALILIEGKNKARDWQSINREQEMIFAWLKDYREMVGKITGLEVLVSNSCQELNQALSAHGFLPEMKNFGPLDFGVVAILDKLVKWLDGPADETKIRVVGEEFPAFKLPESGVNVYKVEGFPAANLLELFTNTDDKLWLFVEKNQRKENLFGLDLPLLSFEVMAAKRKIAESARLFSELKGGQKPAFSGAIIPKIDFDIKPDISFIVGASLGKDDPGIGQAIQQFKFRMDQFGARVKAATSMNYIAFLDNELKPPPFIVDRPFYGWWTQGDIGLPIGAFFADHDSWKEPAGSLEKLRSQDH